MALEAPPEPGPFDRLVRALSAPALVAGEAAWWGSLAPDAVVVDLNYGERAAPVAGVASASRRRYVDGLGLLLHQGALSFTYWTGREAPLEAMRRALAQAT